MNRRGLGPFTNVVLVDTEFHQPPGERPRPICLVLKRWHDSEVRRVWLADGNVAPLFDWTGNDALFVAFFASAEFSVLLELGWAPPAHVLDLYSEFRVLTNGLDSKGNSLLAALSFFGIDSMEAVHKESMRGLALRGGPWTADEREALLAYCESDVVALEKLLDHMESVVDLERALLRGRFMKSVARMERTGVPLDRVVVERLKAQWDDVKRALITTIDQDYGVFEGTTFKAVRWVAWTQAQGILWPVLESGAPCLDEETFRAMSLAHPEIRPMHELRKVLGQLKQLGLTAGSDGRNRTLLSPFRTKTGRGAPSNAAFIFGAPGWLRGCIQPPPGRAIGYVDWCQEEFAIAGVLSGDTAMLAAYESSDPYLNLAIQAGAAPTNATKASHRAVREQFKAVTLGVQFGMGETGLALRIGQSPAHARALLDAHRRTYARFWTWLQSVRDVAFLQGSISTSFGWRLWITNGTKVRTVDNFLMQATGAELLRLAACLATERGIEVCAPIHDAFLIEADLADIEDAVIEMQRAMADASRVVLNGFELRSEARIVRHPERLLDEKGEAMWNRVMNILGTLPDLPRVDFEVAHG